MNEVSNAVFATSICNITPIITEILSKKSTVLFPVTGNSMYPFLRHCSDCVLLASSELQKPSKGKIVLTLKPNGAYVLHRIIKLKKDKYYILGDAQTIPEGPFRLDSVVAVVTCVHRDNKVINTDRLTWRFLSQAWVLLRPFRLILIRLWRSKYVNIIRVRF